MEMLFINFAGFCKQYPARIPMMIGRSTYLAHVSTRHDIFTKCHNIGETCNTVRRTYNENVIKRLWCDRRMQDADFSKCLSRREEPSISLSTAPCTISYIISRADVSSASKLGVDSMQVVYLGEQK